MQKRFLCILLCLVILVGILPIQAPANAAEPLSTRSASLTGRIYGRGHAQIDAGITLYLTGDSFDFSKVEGYDTTAKRLPAGTDLKDYLHLEAPAGGSYHLFNAADQNQGDQMMAVNIRGTGSGFYHGQVNMTVSGNLLKSGKDLTVTPSDDCVWDISPEPSTPPPEDGSYALWFFGTKVTEANKADILGKGKGEASFDPKTNTLTLRANGNSFGTAGTTPMLKSELDHLTLRIESSITMKKQDGIAIEAKNLTIQIANPSASLTVIGKPAAFSQAPLNVPEEIFAGANEASAQRESTWAFDPTTTPYVRLGMHQWQWYWEALFDRGHWFGCKHAGCYAVENVGVHVLEWYPDEEPYGANPGKQHQECKICGYKGPSEPLPGTAPGITKDSLLGSEIGMAYKDIISATGTAPLAWKITSGKLPDGLTLNKETGEISGKPTKAGTFTFTVQVTNQVPGASPAQRNYTINIDEASNNLRFVKRVTKNALKNADADSRENIENAIYNLIFKAQFRPTGINEDRKFENTEKAIFTGSVKVNKNFTIQNIHEAKKTKEYTAKRINDSVLGPIKLQHGCGGCMAYAQFCQQYTYGCTGKAAKFKDFSTVRSAGKVKEFIRKWADPGEEIRLFGHSIVFLGERDDGNGIYCISYGGGVNVNSTSHKLLLEYRSYNSLKEIDYVDDTNGGSYFAGTAEKWEKVREKQKKSKTIIRIECPVEASITLDGFILDSEYGPFERSFGKVERVDDGIVFTLDYSEDYVLDIRGTGTGTMDTEIEYLDKAGISLGSQRFDDMPIAPDTVITSGTLIPECVAVLYYVDDGEYVSAWGANLGETATEADDDLLSTNNTPDNEDGDVEDDTPSPDYDGHTPSKMISIGNVTNGSITVIPKTASKGETVTLTVQPDKGYTLETLTVTDQIGTELELTYKGSGIFTFTMPASEATVTATFMEDNSMLNFFVDVPADAYYYDAVLWAAENGITGGVDDVHFAPNAPCTRAQSVTFLWRAAGSPAPKSSKMPFEDVAYSSYYYDAVLWAVEQGITVGTSATTFSPDAKCTRAQIMTFIYRNEQAQGGGMQGAWMIQNPFDDVDLESYYGEAVMWAVANHVTSGTTDTTFSPNADCTRAQIVTFLYRSMK